jgi:hypothetical protein
MRRPVLLIFTKNTCNIFFSKFHILIWVMGRVVMRFPSSALIHNKNNINTFLSSLVLPGSS